MTTFDKALVGALVSAVFVVPALVASAALAYLIFGA